MIASADLQQAIVVSTHIIYSMYPVLIRGVHHVILSKLYDMIHTYIYDVSCIRTDTAVSLRTALLLLYPQLLYQRYTQSIFAVLPYIHTYILISYRRAYSSTAVVCDHHGLRYY